MSAAQSARATAMREPETTSQFLAAIARGKHRKGAGKRIRKLAAAREIAAFGGLYCYCCGGPVSQTASTIEHIHPKSLGGTDTLENFALSHEECNKKRGDNYTARAAATGGQQ